MRADVTPLPGAVDPRSGRHTARQVLASIPAEGVCWRSGKIRYRNRKMALQALAVARTMRTWHAAGGQGMVYRCKAGCGSWHFSSMDPGPVAA